MDKIEKDLGIKEGYHYFDTEAEKCGVMTHKRTVFVGTLKWKDKEFVIRNDFGYGYAEEAAVYMFEDGNYSCDCNRSIFIRQEYGEDAIPFLKCGDEIELIDYHFEYED